MKKIYFQKIGKVSIILGLFMILSIKANSQNPGYMGKHYMISGTMDFSGVLISDIFDYSRAFWFKFGGEAEAIVSKKNILSFSYSYISEEVPLYYYDKYFEYWGCTLNSSTFSLGITHFNRNSIAPLGYFTKTQLFFIRNTIPDSYINGKAKPGVDPYSFVGYNTSKIKANNFGLSLTFGHKRIYYNSVVVSLGAQIGITYKTGLLDMIEGTSNKLVGYIYFQNFKSNFVAFKMSIGGLFF